MTKEEIKDGIGKSFELFELTRNVIADEMLAKVITLVKIMADGEAKERKEEGDGLCKEIDEDQKKIDELTKLIELKEECIKLFEE